MFNLPKGPFCQSCGIPMDKAKYGTNSDKTLSDLYCSFCYEDGAFTAPERTMPEMIDKVTYVMTNELGMSQFQASTIANMFIPKLKRWNK